MTERQQTERKQSERQEAERLAAIAEGKCPACGRARPDPSVPCPHCHAPALGPADPARPPDGDGEVRRSPVEPLMQVMQVRTSDIEPYIGLRYLSKLFRLMAVILILLLVAEVVTGFLQQGTAAIPTLLPEVSRLIVLAGLLWGAGDLAILLIDVGHDVRATRILLGRQAVHHFIEHQHPGGGAAPHARAGDAARGDPGARRE